MIYYLEGAFAEITPTHVVVDCGGVGYIAHISLNTYSIILKRNTNKIAFLIRKHRHQSVPNF